MKDSLKAGLKVSRRFDIGLDSTIDVLGEDRRVYATPAMVRDIEIACLEMIAEHLDAGEATVGARIELDHVGASLLGSHTRTGWPNTSTAPPSSALAAAVSAPAFDGDVERSASIASCGASLPSPGRASS